RDCRSVTGRCCGRRHGGWTADARRALRESYKRNQETLRQLELDLRPAPLPYPVTGAGPAATSVGLRSSTGSAGSRYRRIFGRKWGMSAAPRGVSRTALLMAVLRVE